MGTECAERVLPEFQARANRDALLIKPYDGAIETLRYLKERGARIAVWTGRDLDSAARIIAGSELRDLVELCVSGTCVQINKPNSEGLRRVLRHFGEPEVARVAMVGDHDHDMIAAREVGTRALRANWNGFWGDVKCARADHQFDAFDDFERWVKSTV